MEIVIKNTHLMLSRRGFTDIKMEEKYMIAISEKKTKTLVFFIDRKKCDEKIIVYRIGQTLSSNYSEASINTGLLSKFPNLLVKYRPKSQPMTIPNKAPPKISLG